MERFDREATEVMNKAEDFAERSGGVLGSEHILCGILACDNSAAHDILENCGLTDKDVNRIIKLGERTNAINLTARTKAIIQVAFMIAKNDGLSLITPDHLLYAILQDTSSYAARALIGAGINIPSLISELENDDDEEDEDDSDEFSEAFDLYKSSVKPGGQDKGGNNSKSTIKELANLGEDLTAKVKLGKLDPVIGRKDEIDRIVQILSRRTKNNPILIGEAGVGKTAIVEGLAQAIVSGNVPEMLKDKIVFSLDMASVLSGAKYRGEFEERLKNAIQAVQKAGNIILFIDEIHTIVGAGASEGSIDAANILKPMLARGELQTIGATTIEEYRKHIEKDSALERRFQPIMVNPPSIEDSIEIIKGIKDKYEVHHKVNITESAILAAVTLSDRYIQDRNLPDKAIDLIDEAASRKRNTCFITPKSLQELEDKKAKIEKELSDCVKKQEFVKAQSLKEEKSELDEKINTEKKAWGDKKGNIEMSIDENDIADIVSSWTGIPVSKLNEAESERLLKLEEILKERVIGQVEAIEAVSKAVRRARAGLKAPNRPIGSFIFLGPTGVGKTELSKALAEAMFGSENAIIRLDMSEYMEKFNVSKLIGSAPGYVGYDDAGQLTEKVKRKPYSVVLFDEIEKAHPDVFNILLQILEDGRLTDSHGKVVSFKNTIIIMTSNIGANEISNMGKLGFGDSASKDDYENMKEKQLEALKRTMRPEFINRIDDIIIFHKLADEDLTCILEIMTTDLIKRVKAKNINLQITDECKKYIIANGANNEYGARPLRRALQKYVEDKLSEEIIGGKVIEGDSVIVDVAEEKIIVKKA